MVVHINMDLFGDLPNPRAQKSSGSGGVNDDGTSDDLFGGLPAATTAAAAAGEKEKLIGKENTSSSSDAKTSAAETGESSTVSSTKRKSAPASLVTTLGKAGTSLAFVPQAIAQARKKKKSTSQPPQLKTEPKKVDAKHQTNFCAEKIEAEDVPAVKDHHSVHRTADKSTTAHPAPKHEDESAEADNNNMNIEQSLDEPYLENEPESIRLLHESVTPANAYNPHFPNDYLAHLERKKTERLQKELQQSALQRLDQQEKLRKKIEEERRKIESSGDVNKIVEMRSAENGNGVGGGGRGRGRGRGVQNLPAWLIKKQQEQQQTQVAEESLTGNKSSHIQGQFVDAEDIDTVDENCAITLFNIVAPGEIDDHLASEIREECEVQSWKVIDIQIFDASASCQLVRADITFADGVAARDAVKLFNGRTFGDRQITAKIME